MRKGDPIPFRKMHGLGNEIVIVDLRGTSLRLSEADARTIASQPRSRFDQLMALRDPVTAGTEAIIDIYNTDGSKAGACGNGVRCVGWMLHQQTGRKTVAIETENHVVDIEVADADHVTVDMGQPRFGWQEIPLARPVADTNAIDLSYEAPGEPPLSSPSVVNVGNPHAVFWVTDIGAHDLARAGPALERHALFPDRVNVSLARVAAPDLIDLRTWERGAGLTKACGSAACAAVVCGARTGRTDRKATVRLPGGTLAIEWNSPNRILMTGPVADEYEGSVRL